MGVREANDSFGKSPGDFPNLSFHERLPAFTIKTRRKLKNDHFLVSKSKNERSSKNFAFFDPLTKIFLFF